MFASFMQYSLFYECLFTAADRWHRKHRKTYKRTDLAPISDQAFWARIRLISEPNTGVLQLSHHWRNLQFASIHHYRLSISQKYFDAAAVIHTVNITIGVVYVCEKFLLHHSLLVFSHLQIGAQLNCREYEHVHAVIFPRSEDLSRECSVLRWVSCLSSPFRSLSLVLGLHLYWFPHSTSVHLVQRPLHYVICDLFLPDNSD